MKWCLTLFIISCSSYSKNSVNNNMRISLIFLISWLHKPSWNYESNLLDVFKLSIQGGINRKSLTIPHAFIVQLQGNFWTAKKKKKLLFFQRETCVTFQKKLWINFFLYIYSVNMLWNRERSSQWYAMYFLTYKEHMRWK